MSTRYCSNGGKAYRVLYSSLCGWMLGYYAAGPAMGSGAGAFYRSPQDAARASQRWHRCTP